MTNYILTVPVTYKTSDGTEKTSYRRVGAVFENTRQDGSGDKILSIKLDFGVTATELVAFPPKPKDENGGAYD